MHEAPKVLYGSSRYALDFTLATHTLSDYKPVARVLEAFVWRVAFYSPRYRTFFGSAV